MIKLVNYQLNCMNQTIVSDDDECNYNNGDNDNQNNEKNKFNNNLKEK